MTRLNINAERLTVETPSTRVEISGNGIIVIENGKIVQYITAAPWTKMVGRLPPETGKAGDA